MGRRLQLLVRIAIVEERLRVLLTERLESLKTIAVSLSPSLSPSISPLSLSLSLSPSLSFSTHRSIEEVCGCSLFLSIQQTSSYGSHDAQEKYERRDRRR